MLPPMPNQPPLPPPIPPGELLDLTVDAVCAVDAQGRFAYVNAAAEALLGYRADELVGVNMIELVHPEDRARTLLRVVDIMAGNDSNRFENRYVRKDGRIVHIQWSARWSPQHGLRIAIGREVPPPA
jgi:PAS domain S-box-containing protein